MSFQEYDIRHGKYFCDKLTLYIHRTIHGVGYDPYGWRRRSNLQPPKC